MDMCGECFKDKLVPWLEAQGATVRMHPDSYARPKRCLCGKAGVRVDGYRASGREFAGKTCRCSGYWFPHRAGSGFCELGNWTDEQMRERCGG